MSRHHMGPGTWPRFTNYRLIAVAVTAIIFLSIAAGAASASEPTALAGATASSMPALIGAGSTFDAPFFAEAFAQYQHLHPRVDIRYSGVGSSAGITRISSQHVDFGASDSPMTASQLAAAKGGPITQVPVALGGVGVAYHLNLPKGTRLHLTGAVLARIYLGKITHWNDPALTALNPGVSLPDATINVVYRSDGSGTTYIFSNYLSAVDQTWASKVGTAQRLKWPTGEGAEGNAGVATTVDRTPFSIGYMEQAYSKGLTLPFAALRNDAGHYVLPSTRTIAAAASQKRRITPTNFSIVNQPGEDSYPISGYSWALLYTRQPNRVQGHALASLMEWLAHDGQAYSAANGCVPLPTSIRHLDDTLLRRITGPTGAPLLS